MTSLLTVSNAFSKSKDITIPLRFSSSAYFIILSSSLT